MRYKIEGACSSVTGKVRENNEDNFYFNGRYLKVNHQDIEKTLTHSFTNEDNMIYGVFDGMGGEASGEVASFIASKTLDEYIKNNQDKVWKYKSYIEEANEKILNSASAKKMGTTVASVSFLADNIKICNLGDSRIYLLRDKKIRKVSEDHTDEELTKKLNLNTKNKPRLTQHLGIAKEELELSPYIVKFDYRENDKFLLCSDGVTDLLTDKEIEGILMKDKKVEHLVDEIIALSLEKGGKDNTTAMIFEVQKEKNNTLYKLIIFITIAFIVLISSFLYLKSNSLNLKDECNNLIVGESCKFEFNEKKYQIELSNNNLEYKKGELIGITSGSTKITIKKGNKNTFERTVKVFPSN